MKLTCSCKLSSFFSVSFKRVNIKCQTWWKSKPPSCVCLLKFRADSSSLEVLASLESSSAQLPPDLHEAVELKNGECLLSSSVSALGGPDGRIWALSICPVKESDDVSQKRPNNFNLVWILVARNSLLRQHREGSGSLVI